MTARDQRYFTMGLRLALSLLEDEQPVVVVRQIHNTLLIGWRIDEARLQPELAGVLAQVAPLVDEVIARVTNGTS
jgi:hypothetical protein